ncbi:MAG TPA: two-component regulator propeller domain-containing protein [Thermoanaerobaculia bacterium]|nr:two-component regulator propeller domain-containing protein [Thermoanaerobaculia bacterium]
MRHHRFWPVALFSLAFAAAAFAIDPSRAMTQYVHRAWTVQNGLPQNTVQALAQTPDGYLWFGTEEGVVRFDGLRFTTFNPSNSPKLLSENIGALVVDDGGGLWVGGRRGVNIYRDGVFHDVPGTAGLTHVFGIARVRETGTTWFASSWKGLQSYRDGTMRRDPVVPDRATSICACRDVVWTGADDGLYRHQAGKTTRVPGLDGQVAAVACDRDGRGVWVGGAGLLHYDGARFTRPIPGLEKESVWAILVDRRGTVWFGARLGLWRWSGGVLSRMGAEDGLSSTYVAALFEDLEGTLWIGTHFGGLNQLRDGVFLPFTPREGLTDAAVWTVAQDRSGAILAGTEQGLNRFANGRWSRVAGGPSGHSQISAVWPDDDGSVWIASDGNGLRHLRKDGTVRAYTKRDGLPSDQLLALLRARDGTLWIGTSAGPVRFAGGRFEVFGKDDGLGGQFVIWMHEDRRGRVWVSTGDGGGPAYFDGTRFQQVKLSASDPPYIASCIYDDSRGDYWFGSRGGLHRLHDGRVFTYTAAHGLVPGMITYVFEDEVGTLWLSGPTGLARVPRKSLDDVLAGRASKVVPVVYGMGDGLPGSSVMPFAAPRAWRAADGKIWMATGRGIGVLDPRANFPVLRARPLVEEVQIDGTAVAPTAGVVMMRPGDDRVQFRYTAPSMTIADRVRFRYRLDEYDTGWIDAGERRVAEYTNLPPGRYRFVVEASPGGESWMSAMTPVAIRRLPAIHQTPWFVLACAMALAGIVWVVHWRRMHALRMQHAAVQSERRRIALEFHDTLATGLTGAILHIQTAMDREDDPAGAAARLDAVKSLLRSTLDDARRTLVNLRAPNAVTRSLADRLTTIVSTMTSGLSVRGSVEVHGTPRALTDPDVQHHLVRIAQEALTNALRHSGARNITVIVDFKRNSLVVTIRDDGRGSGEFSVEQLSETTYGLRGMRERADAIGAKLTARTLARGFEVTVEVPD